MSSKYKIAETAGFQKTIAQQPYKTLYQKIKNYIYPQLRSNPYFGPNIKKLRGEWAQFYRFRLGKYRLFYKVDKAKVIVFVVDLQQRKDSYK